jgi:TetR/AcrR family transcriptional repressor of nem operon
LDAADELMYERGYEAVGVQELCERAGVKKGSFYHWFPSKAALAVAMLDASWMRTRAHIFDPAFGPAIAPLDRFDRLGELLVAHHERVRDQQGAVLGCRFGNFAAELSTRDTTVQARLADVFADMRELFKDAISDAMQTGEIPPVDAWEASAAVLAHMEGLLLVAKAGNEPGLVARFGADVRALLGAPARQRTPSTPEPAHD